jgi:hypothetical protein
VTTPISGVRSSHTPTSPKSEQNEHSRSGFAAATGGLAAGALFLRDRMVQGALIGISMKKHWNEPPLATGENVAPMKWRNRPNAWRAFASLQLLLAEDNNDVVPPRGGLTLFGHAFPNFWKQGFMLNHGMQAALLPIVGAATAFNAKGALEADGIKGLYDTRSGRDSVVAGVETAYLATMLVQAARDAESGSGVKGVWNGMIAHEGLGGLGIWAVLVASENILVFNELGAFDFMGNKDKGEERPWWKELTGLP